MLLALFAGPPSVHAQDVYPIAPARNHAQILDKSSATSPEKALLRRIRRGAARFPFEFRSIDGEGNNPAHPSWGKADAELLRMMATHYWDGAEMPAGADRPSAREISNACAAQGESMPNALGLSSMFWQWGQFLDHDLSLVPVVDPAEAFDIEVPLGDAFFDPEETGSMAIPLDRSFYSMVDGVRQQVNEITAFIDASNVYGSGPARLHALRTSDGTGRLKVSAGDLLPFNDAQLPNAPSSDTSFFLAGDFRANEQVGLSAMHTLFVREHNHWADLIHGLFRRLSDETVFQWSRAMVAAELQAITYREFLPALLGAKAIPPYSGYQSSVNPGIHNEFATAAYRFGHTMLPPELLRLDKQLGAVAQGSLPLAQAFFRPGELLDFGIDPYLRGLAMQQAQELDNKIVDDVRNFLFGPPGAGGFDLASLNIQRGREHGLPGYNHARQYLGLGAVGSFEEISSNPEVQDDLAEIYADVDLIDLWVGGLAEDKVAGAAVGETFHTIIRRQFIALRDGDRFWYQAYLPRFLVHIVERQTLAGIIRRNTGIEGELQDNVFYVR